MSTVVAVLFEALAATTVHSAKHSWDSENWQLVHKDGGLIVCLSAVCSQKGGHINAT